MDNSGLVASNKNEILNVPVASISTLLLGPGTTITHRAIELIGNTGSTVIWVGDGGVRYYAHGRPLTHSSTLLQQQAKLVSNVRSRLSVARKMYQMRFPDENVSKLNMQQLRGREGSRIRQIYSKLSKETGVHWNGREYNPDNYYDSNDINMALSSSNACLYGIIHSVIVAMGCSPGLGFIHTGHERSFVYDIADLYKTEVTIPVSFRVVANSPVDLNRTIRKATRDAIASMHIIERTVKDIQTLLCDFNSDENLDDVVSLWNEKNDDVESGHLY